MTAPEPDPPFDLLLDLVRRHRIDLAQIQLAPLIARFTEALAADLAHPNKTAAPLAKWADNLVAAATLAQMAAGLLTPASPAQQAEAAAQAETLRLRLLNRARLLRAADWLQSRPQLHRNHFPRAPAPEEPGLPKADLTALFRACLTALAIPGEHRTLQTPPRPRLWRPAEATQRILALIETLPSPSPLQAYLPTLSKSAPNHALRARAAVASTLIASLELARQGQLTLDQTQSNIVMARSPGDEAIQGHTTPMAKQNPSNPLSINNPEQSGRRTMARPTHET